MPMSIYFEIVKKEIKWLQNKMYENESEDHLLASESSDIAKAPTSQASDEPEKTRIYVDKVWDDDWNMPLLGWQQMKKVISFSWYQKEISLPLTSDRWGEASTSLWLFFLQSMAKSYIFLQCIHYSWPKVTSNTTEIPWQIRAVTLGNLQLLNILDGWGFVGYLEIKATRFTT